MRTDVKALNEQALRAYNSLMTVLSKIPFDVKTKIAMFDTLVVPLLLYGPEILGMYGTKNR